MIKIPKVNIKNSTLYKATMNYTGELCNQYSPFQNLLDSDTNQFKDFTTEKLNFDLNHPVDLLVQESYDGSVNLIVNDDKNIPRLINSRFSIQEDNTFLIPDHRGYKDTNTYNEGTFDVDSALKPIPLKIPSISFDGLFENQGNLSCGAYTFYFKLSDIDGNESEVMAESGVVQIHIGTPNKPEECRMGLENENSKKALQFTLSNIDSGFDYVHVLYARNSSGSDLASVESYHKINFNYPVQSGQCIINITGNENISTVEQKELYVNYADIQSVKTQTECANVLLFGNVSKPYHDYDALQRMAWKIIPREYIPKSRNTVGHVNTLYKDSGLLNDEDYKMCYYNSKNVYYRLGYWPDEIYRFGIVYIFNDNSLSPVFNIQGIDFSKVPKDITEDDYNRAFFENGDPAWECEPEDYFLNKQITINGIMSDISSWKLNSKGVVKFSKQYTIVNNTNGVMQPKPLGITFDFSHIHKEKFQDKISEDLFKKHNIKGFFFVRQKRIPTILGQGVAIGVTHKEYGSIPVIQNNTGAYISESFLHSDRLLYETGNIIDIPNSNVSVNGLLIPDAELCTGIYNDIFTGNEFCLDLYSKYIFGKKSDRSFIYNYYKETSPSTYIATLLNIPEDIQITSDGENYYSTIAGNPSEPYKTIDVTKSWRDTVPQDLTESTTLVRGKFGSFVGVGSPTKNGKFPFEYGEVYNIKDKLYAEDPETATLLDFQNRFNNYSEYKAISDRMEVINDTITCYRGDCFQSMFTHRMHRNFIDPELPTNTSIVDPSCWAANYGVRCTAAITPNAHSNLTDDSDGWIIPTPIEQPWIKAMIMFLTGNLIGAIKAIGEPDVPPTPEQLGVGADYYYDKGLGKWVCSEWVSDGNGGYSQKTKIWDPNDLSQVYPNGFANEIVQAFEVYVGDHENGQALKATQKKKKVNPSEQETAGGIGGTLKAIFKADEDWELRGLASINRADVNAVGLGHWITFPILSNRNLAFRDIDYSNTTEQASFNKKRSFYPYSNMDVHNPLRDSNVINAATSVAVPHKPYFGITDYRFLKQEYFTRVLNSVTDSANSFTNEYKQILENQYQDYTKNCGSITKMVTVNNITYIVFEHGIGQITFKPTHSGVSPEMMQDVILLTDSYGSIWKDSVIDAGGVIFGVDSVAKKIWCIANNKFKILSDFKVQKFLIDNLDMSEFTTKPYIGHINIKTHYNAYKSDVIFTYYNDKPEKDSKGNIVQWLPGKTWSLCYNMVLDKFITFYDWCPVESVNIDNIYFSFDRDRLNALTELNTNQVHTVVHKENPKGSVWSDDIYQYKIKKFVIDYTFNHTIPVYDLSENSTITLKGSNIFKSTEIVDDYIINFYYQGNIKVYKDKINILDENSTSWKHISLIVPNCHRDDIRIVLNSSGGSLAELSIASLSSFTEVKEWYTKTYSNSNNKESQVFDDTNASPILRYDLRNTQNQMHLWKHGQAGVYDIQGEIKPTTWYGVQYPFSFEFIVNETSSIQKIFNNLKIISNKTEPCKFEYEIVGEGYEWFELKPVIKWINDKASEQGTLEDWYKIVLGNTYGYLVKEYTDFPKLYKEQSYKIPKLLYLDFKHKHSLLESTADKDYEHTNNSSHTTLVYDKRQNDFNVHTVQIGNDIKRVGRVKGNMQYLEDLWDIEIRPVAFKYAYLDKNGDIAYTNQKETRHRDKYIKIKVCYSGEDLAVIQAIQTTFDYSYA